MGPFAATLNLNLVLLSVHLMYVYTVDRLNPNPVLQNHVVHYYCCMLVTSCNTSSVPLCRVAQSIPLRHTHTHVRDDKGILFSLLGINISFKMYDLFLRCVRGQLPSAMLHVSCLSSRRFTYDMLHVHVIRLLTLLVGDC